MKGGVRVGEPVNIIKVRKISALPPERYVKGLALVDQGEEVTFVIEIENRSSATINDFRVIDRLPVGSKESVEAKEPDSSARYTLLNETITPPPRRH